MYCGLHTRKSDKTSQHDRISEGGGFEAKKTVSHIGVQLPPLARFRSRHPTVGLSATCCRRPPQGVSVHGVVVTARRHAKMCIIITPASRAKHRLPDGPTACTSRRNRLCYICRAGVYHVFKMAALFFYVKCKFY